MTVYPFVLHLGRFTITGYGLMMMAGFLLGGGLAGSKIYYAISVGHVAALFTRGGLVWYGGFVGGTVAVFGFMWWKRLPIRTLLDRISPALAVGYLLGRVGCFSVNDDYGRPTSLPWGMKFPHGAPPSTAGNLQAQFHIALPAGTPPDQVLAVHPTPRRGVALRGLPRPLQHRADRRRGLPRQGRPHLRPGDRGATSERGARRGRGLVDATVCQRRT